MELKIIVQKSSNYDKSNYKTNDAQLLTILWPVLTANSSHFHCSAWAILYETSLKSVGVNYPGCVLSPSLEPCHLPYCQGSMRRWKTFKSKHYTAQFNYQRVINIILLLISKYSSVPATRKILTQSQPITEYKRSKNQGIDVNCCLLWDHLLWKFKSPKGLKFSFCSYAYVEIVKNVCEKNFVLQLLLP